MLRFGSEVRFGGGRGNKAATDVVGVHKNNGAVSDCLGIEVAVVSLVRLRVALKVRDELNETEKRETKRG